MAFLDLDAGAPPMAQRVAAPVAKLGQQERKVVLLARTDPASSLRRHPLRRVAAWLFGIEAPHGLADPRLEALRRYAVMYRIDGEALAGEELVRARTAGLTDGELAKARALIDVVPAGRRGRRSGGHALAVLFGLVMAGLLAFGAATQLRVAFDSPLIAAMLIGLALVSLAPLLAQRGASDRAYR